MTFHTESNGVGVGLTQEVVHRRSVSADLVSAIASGGKRYRPKVLWEASVLPVALRRSWQSVRRERQRGRRTGRQRDRCCEQRRGRLQTPLIGAGQLTLLGFKPVSSRLDLSREDLTPGQKETPVCREGVSVGHPRHEVYGLG